MSNETRILALFEEANPVPDIDAMDSERTAPAAYLASLERRSSEVTQLVTQVDENEKSRKPRMWAAAAALVVVAVVFAVLTIVGGEEEPLVAGPPPPGFVGSWSSGPVSVVFDDGQYAFVFDGVLVDHGDYAVAPDAVVMVLTSAEDSPGCAPGDSGLWNFETDDGSSLTLEGVDDACFFRAFIGGFGNLTLTAVNPIDVTGLPTALNLEGKWGDDATGIEITGNDYAIAMDGEIVDRGTYELQLSPYVLVLESESTDPACATATYGVSVSEPDGLMLESERIGGDECPARSGIGTVPLESGGTFEIPETESSG